MPLPSNAKNSDFLGTAPIGRLLRDLSLPAMISATVNLLYNLVDRLYIGNGIGKEAIAGLVLTGPYMIILGAFGMMAGVGSGSVISILLGQKRPDEAEKVLGQFIALCLLFVLTIQGLALAFLDETLHLFGGNELTIPYARDYLRIILWGNVFMHLSFGLSNPLRAEGNSRKAMTVIIIGAVSNLILDPIFIFGLHLGISGAAYATILSMMISSSYALSHFITGKGVLRLRLKNIRIRPRLLVKVLAIGLCPCIIQLSGSAINIVLNNCCNKYAASVAQASDAIAAWGNTGSLMMILLMPIFGLTQGMQPIVGFNTGAKNFQRVAGALGLTLKCAFIACTAIWLVALPSARYLVMIFNRDPELVAVSTRVVRFAFALFPTIGVNIVIGNYFQAIGRASVSILISLLRQVICLIPLLLLFSHFLGLEGIWWSLPCADITAFVPSALCAAYELRRLRALTGHPDAATA